MPNSRPHPTLAKYLLAKTSHDQLLWLCEFFHLAPSPYNTQPWQIAVGEGTLTITPNFKRRLNLADPGLRGLYFALGAGVENVVLAGRAVGATIAVEIEEASNNLTIVIKCTGFPTVPPNLKEAVAVITAINNRHTNRFAFYPDSIPEQLQQYIQSQTQANISTVLIEDQEQIKQIHNLTQEAVKVVFSSKTFARELSSWLKPSSKQVTQGMPGYILGIPKWFSYVLPSIIKYGNANMVMKQQQKIHARWFETAGLLGVVLAPTDSITDSLWSGRLYEKISVEAEGYGVAFGPMSALVEAPGFAKKLADLLGTPKVPLMVFRLGFPQVTPPESPRLPLSQIVNVTL